MTEPFLNATDVVLTFGETPALRGATIAIDAGEAICLVGPSGSGKSSLLHCLSGVLKPTSGTVTFMGTRLDQAGDHELSDIRRRDFGFVFQFAELLPELSLVENVSLPLRLGGVHRRDAERRSLEVLERLSVGELADRKPSEVSGGQLQRAAVARGLVHQPKVVFADEPTGALDSVTTEEVLELLFDPDVRERSTLVVVTHDPNVARRGDRVITVVDGLAHDLAGNDAGEDHDHNTIKEAPDAGVR